MHSLAALEILRVEVGSASAIRTNALCAYARAVWHLRGPARRRRRDEHRRSRQRPGAAVERPGSALAHARCCTQRPTSAAHGSRQYQTAHAALFCSAPRAVVALLRPRPRRPAPCSSHLSRAQ
eukprot:380546-Pleurochrysis_carterae.AAC.1